jgi:hypothetical protein
MLLRPILRNSHSCYGRSSPTLHELYPVESHAKAVEWMDCSTFNERSEGAGARSPGCSGWTVTCVVGLSCGTHGYSKEKGEGRREKGLLTFVDRTRRSWIAR